MAHVTMKKFLHKDQITASNAYASVFLPVQPVTGTKSFTPGDRYYRQWGWSHDFYLNNLYFN